jgi:hypothetical protein
MAGSEQRLNLGFFLVTATWLLALAALGSHQVLLFFAPALLLALPLALGRYPGEERLRRVRESFGSTGWSKRAPAPAPAPRRRPLARLPRGAALLASGLATRPPPRRALT